MCDKNMAIAATSWHVIEWWPIPGAHTFRGGGIPLKTRLSNSLIIPGQLTPRAHSYNFFLTSHEFKYNENMVWKAFSKMSKNGAKREQCDQSGNIYGDDAVTDQYFCCQRERMCSRHVGTECTISVVVDFSEHKPRRAFLQVRFFY